MKRVLTSFLALSAVTLLMLSSCKKNDALATSNGGKAGDLKASNTTLVLDKTKLTDTTMVIDFTISKPDYGYQAAVTNTLQIDAAGDNWAKPTSVTLGTKVLSQGYTTVQFNALLLKLNLPAGVSSQVNVRVMHAISTSVTPIYSNVVSLAVTPFNLTSYVYVVGDFQGWNANAADSLVSVTGNGVYTGIIHFGTGNPQFLVLPKKGTYDNKYATNDAQGSTSSTITQNAPNNFYAPSGTGYYIITFNLNNNTISFGAADSYSLIGSAAPGTAWSTDTQLKFINDGSNTWVLNSVPMTVGEYKFRLNDQWTTSWGPGATDGTIVTSGAVGDGNLQLTTAGNYNLSLVQPPTVTGTDPAPLATTTYTAVKQ